MASRQMLVMTHPPMLSHLSHGGGLHSHLELVKIVSRMQRLQQLSKPLPSKEVQEQEEWQLVNWQQEVLPVETTNILQLLLSLL